MPSDVNFQLLIPDTMPRSVGYSQVATVTADTPLTVAWERLRQAPGLLGPLGDGPDRFPAGAPR